MFRDSEMPVQVRISSHMAFALAVLLGPAALLVCSFGSVFGWHILIPGLFLALIVVLLFLGRLGLKQGRPWSRRLLVIVSFLAFLGLLFPIGYFSLTGKLGWESNKIGIVALAALLVSFETMGLMLSSKAAIDWFEQTGWVRRSSLDGIRGLSEIE